MKVESGVLSRDEGDHGLVFTPEACGCAMIGEGKLGDALRIRRCELHTAAADLAEAVRLLVIALGKRKPEVSVFPGGYRLADQRDELLAVFIASSAMRKAGLPDPFVEPTS
jgi:hypothetical protein